MARSINIAKLLSVYAVLMDDDHVRTNFVKYVAETHPRILLKFSGRDDEENQRMKEWENDRAELRRSQAQCEELARNLRNIRDELNAMKNPVSNNASDAIKVLFDRLAVEQDQTFGMNLAANVRMSFVLHDQNMKIHTIKWCREQTGYGLAEAKGWVEGCSSNDYKCTFATALKLRDSFRTFARRIGYTGVIYIKGE